MVMEFEILRLLANVIGLVTVAISKLIVSPAIAILFASLRVHVGPGHVPPISELLLTVIVAAGLFTSRAVTRPNASDGTLLSLE